MARKFPKMLKWPVFFQEFFRSDPRRSSRPKRTFTVSSNTGQNVHGKRNVSSGRPVTWTFDLVFLLKVEMVKTKERLFISTRLGRRRCLLASQSALTWQRRNHRERPGDTVKPGEADGGCEGLVEEEQREVDVAREEDGGAALCAEGDGRDGASGVSRTIAAASSTGW